jgi:hypothetical protein
VRYEKERGGRRKSNDSSTVWGLAGGAALGDLIVPGLGTVGGAILGGGLGREAGKRRKHRGNGDRNGRGGRDTYDREWDEGWRRRGESRHEERRIHGDRADGGKLRDKSTSSHRGGRDKYDEMWEEGKRRRGEE